MEALCTMGVKASSGGGEHCELRGWTFAAMLRDRRALQRWWEYVLYEILY